jgi:hypothetical protein
MNSPLHIVYLEDDPADVRLVRDILADDGLCVELTAMDIRAMLPRRRSRSCYKTSSRVI